MKVHEAGYRYTTKVLLKRVQKHVECNGNGKKETVCTSEGNTSSASEKPNEHFVRGREVMISIQRNGRSKRER